MKQTPRRLMKHEALLQWLRDQEIAAIKESRNYSGSRKQFYRAIAAIYCHVHDEILSGQFDPDAD